MEDIWDKLWDVVVSMGDLAVFPIVAFSLILSTPIIFSIYFEWIALYVYLPVATSVSDKVTVLSFAYALVGGLAVATSWYVRNVIVRLYLAYKRKG